MEHSNDQIKKPLNISRKPAATKVNEAPNSRAAQSEIRQILGGNGIQMKLTIGAPNDRYEQEADRVADDVMRMPDAEIRRQEEGSEEEEEEVQAKPLSETISPLVQKQAEPEEEEEEVQAKPLFETISPLVQMQPEPDEEEEEVQAKPLVETPAGPVQREMASGNGKGDVSLLNRSHMNIQRLCSDCQDELQLQSKGDDEIRAKSNGGGSELEPELATEIHSIKGGGQPLNQTMRSFMEPRIGADFGGVRIHTGSKAEKLSRSINAKAFTVGSDIVFGAGQYSPNTSDGKSLLAHELTHVVQQQGFSAYRDTPVQRRLFVSGAVEAEVREYLNLVGGSAGFRLNWAFSNPRVRIAGNTVTPPTSDTGRRNLRTVINNPSQHAEIHIGRNQPRVSIGAFPGAGSMIQNIDIDDIRNLNASLPNQGTAKAFHEMMENYNHHAAGTPGFGPSHQVGIEAESDVLEESGIAGRRVRLGGGAPVIIPAPVGQPTGPNIHYQRSVQVFTHYFLEFIHRVTTGSPTGPGADFEIVSARRIPKVQVSQHTVDRFASGSSVIPATGNANLVATLADLNAHANSTLELEGFADSVGSESANRRLTRQRVESVRAWFIGQGINTNRIAIVGRGETSFVAPNNTAAGRAQNRRVIMTVHRP